MYTQMVDDRAQPAGANGQRDQELLADALQEGQAVQEHRARQGAVPQAAPRDAEPAAAAGTRPTAAGETDRSRRRRRRRRQQGDGAGGRFTGAAERGGPADSAAGHGRPAVPVLPNGLLHLLLPGGSCTSGVSASASEEGSSGDHQLDGGATWGWGSLWNLDDVVDDVDGGACGWDSSFPLLQDQGLAFY